MHWIMDHWPLFAYLDENIHFSLSQRALVAGANSLNYVHNVASKIFHIYI